ncbi:hypothetical protein ZIOFF_065464 [Zingiber officinale]|uniref:Jacalin-type lectin domain-containing protein n=1 Tax=Zingiber officinale TaxID=94328 RepID=A0A8J5F017_ZINOF|nr:hypothetical protein ZIOFF_065464 [Zingiber officinale]
MGSFHNNIKIGPWGGHGEHNFDIGPSASQITRVVLHTGLVVDSLEIFYVTERNEAKTCRVGGTGGGFHEFELLPGEYINSMVGSIKTFYGETCIAKLGFKTNTGKKHGPFGHGGGMEFTVPVLDGRIVGFFGQFNSYLNGIGVYLAPK